MKPFLLALAALAPSATAQPERSAGAGRAERTILFVGNSFTHGQGSAVERYRPQSVTDLNGHGYGGVPALFKRFAEQTGLNWRVSLETQGGKTLGFHYEERRDRLRGRYDVVVLQEFSVLDPDKPGDPAKLRRYAPLLADLSARSNPHVRVLLMATWARPDQVYGAGQRWSGQPIAAMARDLRDAAEAVDEASTRISGVIPVGETWDRAFAAGFADPNPFDGIAAGQVSLWSGDHYHASTYGSYLEALVVFGKVTEVDPKALGDQERAAADLGISRTQAARLQAIASEQLASER